ncbi:MAG: PRC-barrel domain-containing protein, partial [Desulfofustis sp.]
RVHARDDDIGHVEDFLVEEDTWKIRYLVIDTGTWLPGSKRVIVDPNWVDAVDWSDRSVAVRMTKEQIENSPEYDPHDPNFRDYEKSLFDHYKAPYYWI